MKRLILIAAFMLSLVEVGVAQKAEPTTSRYLLDSLRAPTVTAPLPDSMRRAVHKLFKWGRLYGTIGALSGGIMVAGAITYVARRDDDWTTGVQLALGANALTFGTISMVRFSRKRERQLLASLEQGEPLPPDVAAWLPLVRTGSQRKKR